MVAIVKFIGQQSDTKHNNMSLLVHATTVKYVIIRCSAEQIMEFVMCLTNAFAPFAWIKYKKGCD